MSPSKKNPVLRVLRLMRRDAVQSIRFTRRWFGKRGFTVLMALMVVLGGVALLHPCDDDLIRSIASVNAASSTWKSVAKQFSFFGDFLGFNVALLVVFQLSGWLMRSRKLMRLAVASLLCACLAGAVANVLRPAFGRPRPSSKIADGFYGPTLKGDLHALPSAHTATAFGGALPVLMAHPLIGAPLTLAAAAIAWSRLQLDRHHLTDVLVSIVFAFTFALPLSQWVNRGHLRSRPSVSHALSSSRQP